MTQAKSNTASCAIEILPERLVKNNGLSKIT